MNTDDAIVDYSESMSEVPTVQAPSERFVGGQEVKGRVFLYDDTTKTLILKLWDDQTQSYSGIGLYNARNVKLERIHVLQDVDEDMEGTEYTLNDTSENGQDPSLSKVFTSEVSNKVLTE